MIASVLLLLGGLVVVSVYSVLLLAVTLPRAYENGRVHGRLEQTIRHEDSHRRAHRAPSTSNVTPLPIQRFGGRL